jgi:hypothetical protein
MSSLDDLDFILIKEVKMKRNLNYLDYFKGLKKLFKEEIKNIN